MKRFKKIYLEIGNICNLKCDFCKGTKRAPRLMETDEFKEILIKIKEFTDYLYFHLLGEPLLHPNLAEFLSLANEIGFKVTITTNGTLIDKNADALLKNPPYKTVISLHSFEANGIGIPLEDYLKNCFEYGKMASEKGIVVFRLWNKGGKDALNTEIENKLKKYFTEDYSKTRNGIKLQNNVYLEYGEKFDWPDIQSSEIQNPAFCMGLRDQLGILSDGTVVPCCLDSDGEINLGNIFKTDFEDIINSQRARNIYDGFSRGSAAEELCKKCSFAKRFD